jgi:hypothetical protein
VCINVANNCGVSAFLLENDCGDKCLVGSCWFAGTEDRKFWDQSCKPVSYWQNLIGQTVYEKSGTPNCCDFELPGPCFMIKVSSVNCN